MRSEEKLPIEVGLFYEVGVCDAHLSRCRVEMFTKRTTTSPNVRSQTGERKTQLETPTCPELLANPTPSRAKFFSISQPMAPQPTWRIRHYVFFFFFLTTVKIIQSIHSVQPSP